MSERTNRWGIGIAVAVAFSVGLLGTARAAVGSEEEILAAFKEGVTLYETGEYEQARGAFDRVLAMEPGMETALKMRDMAELHEFVEMEEKLGPDAEKVLDLMLRASRERKRTVENAEQLIQDFAADDLAVYGKARVQLMGHGPYAVPCVLPLLALDAPDQQVLAGRAISLLAGLQRDACLPLICAMQNADDDLLRTRVAGVLGQLGDPRAVPALVALWEAEGSSVATKEAAAKAVEGIISQSESALGSASAQYAALSRAYFDEDKAVVGYTYGLSADVWQWNASGARLADKVVYQQVPAYLYYQRMATGTALDGLAGAPCEPELGALLAASLVRQAALCEYFKVADIRFGGREVEEQLKQDAADRAAEFATDLPVTLALMDSTVLARALQLTLEADDGSASLLLTKALDAKLAAAGGRPPCAEAAEALMAALQSGDKDVRYAAAIVLVGRCPTGECGAAGDVMKVMSAALKAAATRNALVAMSDFQLRNTLVTVVRDQGIATTETELDDQRVEFALSLQPSVDIVFVSGNASDMALGRTLTLLAQDPRTKAAPIYAVVNPGQPSADLTRYGQIAQVLSPDDLRAAKLVPILQKEVLSRSRSAFTEEEEQTVLRAACALAQVSPLNTGYPVQELEPPLMMALTGYSDEVTAAATAVLGAFGSDAALVPLSRVVADEEDLELKVAGCHALAGILKRSDAAAPDGVVSVLKDALATDVQALREAAAEALSAAGLDAGQLMLLVRTEGLGEE